MGHALRRISLRALWLTLAVMSPAVVLAAPARASFAGLVGDNIAFHSNRDGDTDIYTTIPGNPTIATKLTNNTARDEHPRWSPDGKKIVFDSTRDGNLEIYTMNADGTSQTRITNNAAFDEYPNWSPDGTKIVFDSSRDGDTHGEIYTMNADGTGVTRLTNDPGFDFYSGFSPDGTKITWQSSRNANQYDIFSMNADGTAQTNLTNTTSSQDINPNWSPDGTRIAFSSNSSGNYDIYMMNPDGTGRFADPLAKSFDELAPAYQPDWKADSGGVLRALYTAGDAASDIYRNNVAESNGSSVGALDDAPDWQPVNNSYARPRGASPFRIPIVPAYKRCTSPTTTHRGVVADPACFAPTPESQFLTVGSPESNGQAANSTGFVLFKAKQTTPEDGTIDVNLTDVRCQKTSGGCSSGALSDYTGDLALQTNFQITDRNNGPTGVGPSANGTTTPIVLTFLVPCAATASATVGATCSVSTSLDAVLGGATAVADGKRAIWEILGSLDSRVIEIFDGGSDGVASTTGTNTLFAVAGLFFP
jgi:Tol biopolymer transport system component